MDKQDSLLAERMSGLAGEGAMEIFAKASAMQAEGRDIIHLEIGEPDFPTPDHIVQAAVAALRDGKTRYTPAPGIPQLRKAIAESVSARIGSPVDAGQVVVTPGAKAVAFFAMLALLEPGDEVIYADPGFPVYASMVSFTGARAVPVRLVPQRQFGLDLQDFAAKVSPQTKLIVVNSPQNPTGGILDGEALQAVAAAACRSNAYVLSDEIYHWLQYDDSFVSIASLPGMQERTIILDGFSKTYAMTGWRLGYCVLPPDLVDAVTRLVINSNSCTCTFVQWAGLAALEGPQEACEAMALAFRRRRELIVKGLNSIDGVRCGRPRGAFYVFPDVSALGIRSRELAAFLLETAGVATIPGSAFGVNGEGFLRLTYANSEHNIQRALERISSALGQVRGAGEIRPRR